MDSSLGSPACAGAGAVPVRCPLPVARSPALRVSPVSPLPLPLVARFPLTPHPIPIPIPIPRPALRHIHTASIPRYTPPPSSKRAQTDPDREIHLNSTRLVSTRLVSTRPCLSDRIEHHLKDAKPVRFRNRNRNNNNQRKNKTEKQNKKKTKKWDSIVVSSGKRKLANHVKGTCV